MLSSPTFIFEEIPMEEKISDGKIDYSKSNNKILNWFRNYWYYYKWIVIGIVFALVVVIFCTCQTCASVSEDITLLYAGPFPPANSGVPAMKSAFEAVLPDDFNGNGDKDVAMAMLMIYSEEQLKALEEQASNEVVIDRYQNATEHQKFQSLIVSGEYYVCLLDPWLFEEVNKEKMFMTLEEAIGYKPKNAANDYAIRLSDTEFGQYYNAIGLLPADTYLCIRSPGAMQEMTGKGAESKRYKEAVATVKAIIEFKAPEESK